MVKHAATQIQPYPPSRAVSLSVVSSTATPMGSAGDGMGSAAEGACCFDIEEDAEVSWSLRGLMRIDILAIGMSLLCLRGVTTPTLCRTLVQKGLAYALCRCCLMSNVEIFRSSVLYMSASRLPFVVNVAGLNRLAKGY
jgi:hypothetical protein